MSTSRTAQRLSSAGVTVEPPESLQFVKLQLSTGPPASSSGHPLTPDAQKTVLSRSASESTASPASSSSRLKLEDRRACTDRRQVGDVIEESGSSEDGNLRWGEKQGIDGSWTERWASQTMPQRQPGNKPGEVVDGTVTFGQSSGESARNSTTWTASWREVSTATSTCKTVDKVVMHKLPGLDGGTGETVQEQWDEKIVVRRVAAVARTGGSKLWNETITTTKQGSSMTTGQTWFVDSTEEATVSVSSNDAMETRVMTAQEITTVTSSTKGRCETVTKKLDATGATVEETVTVVAEDGSRTRKSSVRRSGGGAVVTEESRAANGELVNSLITETDGADRLVRKKETKVVLPDAEDHVEVTIESELTVSVADDGSTKHERTEHEVRRSNGLVVQKRSTVDQWNGKPRTRDDTNEVREGLKSVSIENFNERGQITDSKVHREKWKEADDGDKSVDSWSVEKVIDAATGRIVRAQESGRRFGSTVGAGGELWEERWERIYDESDNNTASTAGTANIGVSFEEAAANDERPLCPESQSDCSHLVLRSRRTDRWWADGNGRRGKIRFADLRTGEQSCEDWYCTAEEEQHDVWEVKRCGGARCGEKRGWSHDGRRKWEERWTGEREGGEYELEKRWDESSDAGRKQWGELEGASADRRWTAQWGNESSHGKRRTWHTRYSTYGEGGRNESVTKEGEEWRNEGANDVQNWWCDRYGVHEGERWAVKTGGNSTGDSWKECWNEAPNEKVKTAAKSGRNCEGEWSETWRENGSHKWAEKRGRNFHTGEEWTEEWVEDGEDRKTAVKKGRNAHEEWEERWGEEFQDGRAEKWTDRWARTTDGRHAHGESWGERWTNGEGGHRWGEKWADGHSLEKWAHDTERPSFDLPRKLTAPD